MAVGEGGDRRKLPPKHRFLIELSGRITLFSGGENESESPTKLSVL